MFFGFLDDRSQTLGGETEKMNLSVKRIPYSDCKPFIMKIHYARRMPVVQYAFGLFDGDYPFPVGVVTYGTPASPQLCKGIAGEQYRKNVLELNRLVLYPEYNGENYASFLVSHSLKQLPDGTIVVSYADWGGWGHVGYIYQATNWLYTGITKPRTDIYSETGHARHHLENETRRMPRTAKHRYVYLVGNRRTKRKLMSSLKYPILPEYPKGDSRHYDIDHPVSLLDERVRDDAI